MTVAGQEEDQGDGTVKVTEPGEIVDVPPQPEPGDGDGEGEATPPPPKNRKERRRDAMADANERAERAERAANEASARAARAESATNELRAYMAGQQERQRGGDAESALNARVTRLRQDAQGHLERSALAAKAGDRATAEREMTSYQEKLEEASWERFQARMGPQIEERLREVQGNIPSAEMMATRDKLGKEFPALYDDAEYRAAVDARINTLVAQGKPQNYLTYRDAAATVAKRMGIGGQQAPTEQNRQRYQAVAGGQGGGGGDGTVQVPWGPTEKRLAMKLYPGLEGNELKQAFVKEMADRKRKGEW